VERADLQFWLFVAQTLVSWGLLVVFVAWTTRESKVGPLLHRVREPRTYRTALLAVHTGLFVVTVAADEFPSALGGLTLAMAALLTVLAPGTDDQACGENGVSRGWFGLRYDELEEWRLSGQHLRFRMFGEWTAVEVPSEKRGRVRAILARVARDAESRYRE